MKNANIMATIMLLNSTALANAQGQLNLYCSVQVEWCQAIALPSPLRARA